MHRGNRVQPLDIHDLENKLFNYRDIEKKEENNESSCFVQIWQSIFASTIKETLEEARENYEELCTKRELEMKSIVLHKKCSVPWLNILWGLVGTLLGMVAVFIGFVLWPTENVFFHPDHWYECMLQCGIVWVGKLLPEINTHYSSFSSYMCSFPAGKHLCLDEPGEHAHPQNLCHLLPVWVCGYDVLLVSTFPSLGSPPWLAIPYSSCRSHECLCWCSCYYSCNLV